MDSFDRERRMKPRPEKIPLPRGAHLLRCPACQSADVHVAPREGEYIVIVCVSCYKRWAVSLASDDPESPGVA